LNTRGGGTPKGGFGGAKTAKTLVALKKGGGARGKGGVGTRSGYGG